MITGTRSASPWPRDVTAPAWVLWAIVGTIVAPILVKTVADPDLWGHVRFGLDILANHTVPTVDPYSFTQDVPWIDHEWLSELLMGAAYQFGGPRGLSLLRGVLVAVCLVLVLRPYGRAAPPAFAGAIVLLLAGTMRQVADESREHVRDDFLAPDREGGRDLRDRLRLDRRECALHEPPVGLPPSTLAKG